MPSESSPLMSFELLLKKSFSLGICVLVLSIYYAPAAMALVWCHAMGDVGACLGSKPHIFISREAHKGALEIVHSVELHLEEGSSRGKEENHSRGRPLAWEARTASSVK